MSIIDDIRAVVELQPKATVGYIIACAPTAYADRPDPEYRLLFVKYRLPPYEHELTGGGIECATVFSTYQEASEAALCWHHTCENPSRIIRVKTSAPIAITADYPVTLIDALAEL